MSDHELEKTKKKTRAGNVSLDIETPFMNRGGFRPRPLRGDLAYEGPLASERQIASPRCSSQSQLFHKRSR